MDKIFIEQAKQIRREFIRNSKEINRCEEEIEIYKQKLSSIQDELNDDMNKDDMLQKLVQIEKNMKIIEEILKPYEEKVLKLQKDADKLYENIKERHKSITQEEIEKELIPHLTEIKF
jgi:chromosome segregation ATPase